MSDVLATIVSRTRRRVEERRRAVPLDGLLDAATDPGDRRGFKAALERRDRVNVIAEHKRRSPSKGAIREDLEPMAVAAGYEMAGAAALSILTEPEFFGGDLDHLKQARAATAIPALRKDFIVDRYQVWEARGTGADALLLIVAALTDDELRVLMKEAADARVDVLTEVHDGDELDRALALGASVIGVNNRNLRTMEVTLETSLTLIERIPDAVTAVAESGIKTGADIKRLRSAGFDAFLIGEHLMASPDPGAALSALLREAS